MYLFTMKADAALVFFEAVKELEELEGRTITEEERVLILTEMAKMGYIDSVSETNRTKEEVIRDSVKNFGDVMYFKDDGTTEFLKAEDEDDGDQRD